MTPTPQNEILIIALEYLEPEFEATRACIKATGLPVCWANRDGVGNMSRAFNDAFKWTGSAGSLPKYVWFVTNVIFDKDVPFKLREAMDSYDLAAVHPAMQSSDHPFQKPNGTDHVCTSGFIELTAPMYLAEEFMKYYFCEQTPYWFMDLIIGHQFSKNNLLMGVHHGTQVKHKYLRDSRPHKISMIRRQLREYFHKPSVNYMIQHYGRDWEQKLRFNHY